EFVPTVMVAIGVGLLQADNRRSPAETAPKAATARRERSAVMAEGYRARPAGSPRGVYDVPRLRANRCRGPWGAPCCAVPGAGVGRGWVSLTGTGRVPLRPPVPPQRHDCPQLGSHATRGRAAPPRRAEASRPRAVVSQPVATIAAPTESPRTPLSGRAMPIAP